MANTIDELNFEVIISDKQFDQQIKAIEKKARDFNTSLSNILNIRKISTQMSQNDVENARRVWQAKVDEQRAQERINREKIRTEGLQRKINAQIDGANKRYQAQGRILNELKGYALGYLSIHGASQLLSSLVRVTGEFELQKTTLAAMLGDLNKAEGVITKIQGLAVESPFQFKELTTYAKQLSAFSVPAQELYNTTKMLADISAGLGVGMDRIVLAYGQVRSAAFLRGQEVRQFTEAGIPILDELAKQFTELEGRAVSTGEVFEKISQRLVPFEMVAKVFKDMTSEGGKFYNMQEIQAETLRGKLSNLKDAYEVMLNEIGKGQSENLKGAVDWARKLMQNYEQTGRILVELVAAYGVYRTALVVTANLQSTLARNLVVLRRGYTALASSISVNPYALLAGGIAALSYAIYKSATHLEAYEKIQKSLVGTNKKYTKSLNTEKAKLEALYNRLELAKEGTEEYEEAKKAIYTNYASYISDLKNEGIEVDNLAGIYGKLAEKVEASTKARFRGVASENVNNTYGNVTQDILGEAERATERLLKKTAMQLNTLQQQAVQAYVSGVLTMEDLESDSRLQHVASILKLAADSGNDEWMQFGTSIETARQQFAQATQTWIEGMAAIDEVYGKMEDTMSGGGLSLIGEGDEDPAKKIQAEIDAVNRLRDTYDTLAPYMNGEMLRKTLTALFPNADQELIKSLDFRAKLVELAAELNKFDETASQKLLDSLSGERAGEIASAFKAVETYKNMLDSWLGEDFNLTGEGVTFDISKIIRDLNNQYGKINQKAIEASDLLTKAQMGDEAALKTVREVYGEEVWQKYLINGKATIDELARLEREEAKKTADEKIRDLSSKYISEQMSKNNISLSDFGDKTAEQIQVLIDRMRDIQTEAKREADAALVDILLGDVSEGQYARWQMLLDVIEKLGIKINDTEEELKKKIVDSAIKGMDAISGLGKEISNLGEGIDNSVFTKLGENLERTASAASDMIKAFQAKDTIALIANVVSYVISSITDVITSAYEQQIELNDAARQYQEIMIQTRRDAHTDIFGTDEMALATENAKILIEAQQEYQDALNAFQNDKKMRYNKTYDSFLFGQSVADILGQIANDQGWDLYRENGELNIDKLIAYYDAYSKHLTKEQKRMVDAVIEGYEAQNDAAAQSAEYLTNLFSGVADNIAQSMVDAFLESGDAATDFGELIKNVAKEMAIDLVKSTLLKPIMDKYKAAMDYIMAQTNTSNKDKINELVRYFEAMLVEVGNVSKDATEILKPILGQYVGQGGESISVAADGIKGITEDTANLLASYLNAIRTDVSYAKVLWNAMSQDTRNIANALIGFSAPSLMEYQAQIAANTFNTAMHTQSIMEDLRSVMTSEEGYTAIRTLS